MPTSARAQSGGGVGGGGGSRRRCPLCLGSITVTVNQLMPVVAPTCRMRPGPTPTATPPPSATRVSSASCAGHPQLCYVGPRACFLLQFMLGVGSRQALSCKRLAGTPAQAAAAFSSMAANFQSSLHHIGAARRTLAAHHSGAHRRLTDRAYVCCADNAFYWQVRACTPLHEVLFKPTQPGSGGLYIATSALYMDAPSF